MMTKVEYTADAGVRNAGRMVILASMVKFPVECHLLIASLWLSSSFVGRWPFGVSSGFFLMAGFFVVPSQAEVSESVDVPAAHFRLR